MLRFVLACQILLLPLGCKKTTAPDAPTVVLYCAQDQEFAEGILADFHKKTGIQVLPKFDTEAQKSVALCEELVREAGRPRCDVHWNNEILGTLRLQKQGLLEVYHSPSADPYPEFAKAKDHSWNAFAARARVLIVNTDLVAKKDRPRSIFDLTKPEWKGKVAMAKPEFGTTATHAACLFEVLGADRAKSFYRELKANGVQLASGNKQVADGVAKGTWHVGMTDTDDAIIELKAGKPVAIIFPDRDTPKGDRMGTLFIPNTLAVVKGCPHADAAKKLVDYLLSEEVETKLATSASHQIPLNPRVGARPHPQIETPASAKAMEVDFGKAADLWEQVQAFLREEFARP